MIDPVQNFDFFCGVSLQAEPQTKTKVAELSNRLTKLHHQLVEVWIFREDGAAMPLDFAKNLLAHYEGKERELLHSAAIHNLLVSEFTFGLRPSLAHFHFSLLEEPEHGLVLSAVFGSEQGMYLMYESGLRSSEKPELSDTSD